MGFRAAWLAALVALCAAGTPALAAPTEYDVAFVKAFEEACVPGRLGYQSTRDAAEAAGWEALAGYTPELAALLMAGEEAAADPELKATYEVAAYGREVEGLPHFLVVTRTSAVITEGEAPFVQVGCYLYNFDATVPVDPEPVTALIGNPISRTDEAQGAISHVWGPGCTMPRTFDTYLGFVAEGSEAAASVPFTGVSLNFSTSEPAPGEEVPETYCTEAATADTEMPQLAAGVDPAAVAIVDACNDGVARQAIPTREGWREGQVPARELLGAEAESVFAERDLDGFGTLRLQLTTTEVNGDSITHCSVSVLEPMRLLRPEDFSPVSGFSGSVSGDNAAWFKDDGKMIVSTTSRTNPDGFTYMLDVIADAAR
jgi:hypothetical protein